MRIKKGFTLAEILIVLMVIGAIATMTIPSLMKGVTEAQYKTAYKKAYNTIVNLCAMEKVNGNLPVTGSNADKARLYQALVNGLSVKAYVTAANGAAGVITPVNAYGHAVTVQDAVLGGTNVTYGSGAAVATYTGAGDSPWIVTEDNMAYQIMAGGIGNNQCDRKQALQVLNTPAGILGRTCATILVDVNGLSTGPNIAEPQSVAANGVNGRSLDQLTGDRYRIYIGYDGATTGDSAFTAEARIVGNMK